MSKREKATKAESYTGILNEPMPLPRKSVLGPTIEKQTAQIKELLFYRVAALFNHYGIDPMTDDPWMDLALSLAQKHVPGFQFGERKPGAPYKRADDDVTIYFRVKQHVAKGQSITNACRLIEQSGVVEDLKVSAIRQRYYGFRKEGKIGWYMDRMADYVENVVGSEAAKELFK